MTEEERDQAKHLKFAKIECAFWKHVDLGQVSSKVSGYRSIVWREI